MAVMNPRDVRSFNEHWAKILADPEVVAKAVLADGVLVGYVSCFGLEGSDFVGYWIAREHWARGIASRALGLLLEQVPRRPLHARVAKQNVASIRVLERNGFVVTGYRRSPADDRYPTCEEALLTLH